MKKIFLFCLVIFISASAGAYKKEKGLVQEPSEKKKVVKTFRSVRNDKNIKWDLNIKKKFYEEQLKMLEKKKILVDDDKKMVARLQKILDSLKSNSLIPDLPYEVHYVDHKTVNAVCYPGGGILFFKGLFDPKEGLVDAKSDDEIATVMAHEIAHATLRHGYKKYVTATKVQIFTTIASVAAGAFGGADLANVLDAVVDVGTGLYFPSYSRKHESEADLEGLFMMKGAGYNMDTAVSLWERASQKKGGKTSIFSTHPGSSQRADDLKQHIENLKSL